MSRDWCSEPDLARSGARWHVRASRECPAGQPGLRHACTWAQGNFHSAPGFGTMLRTQCLCTMGSQRSLFDVRTHQSTELGTAKEAMWWVGSGTARETVGSGTARETVGSWTALQSPLRNRSPPSRRRRIR